MPLMLNVCGPMIRQKLDALTAAEASNPQAVAKAIGDGVEEYVQTLLLQLSLTIPPTAGLGTTTTPGVATGPGPEPVVLPGVLVFK